MTMHPNSVHPNRLVTYTRRISTFNTGNTRAVTYTPERSDSEYSMS